MTLLVCVCHKTSHSIQLLWVNSIISGVLSVDPTSFRARRHLSAMWRITCPFLPSSSPVHRYLIRSTDTCVQWIQFPVSFFVRRKEFSWNEIPFQITDSLQGEVFVALHTIILRTGWHVLPFHSFFFLFSSAFTSWLLICQWTMSRQVSISEKTMKGANRSKESPFAMCAWSMSSDWNRRIMLDTCFKHPGTKARTVPIIISVYPNVNL